MRICVLTTSFPRWSGDISGLFIFEPLKRLVARGVEVEVVAPHSRGVRAFEVLGGIRVHRFRYAPLARWQRLCYENSLPYALRFSHVARSQLPSFLFAFTARAARIARRCDLVHAHWVLAGMVALLTRSLSNRPYVLSLHGSDVYIGLNNGRLIRSISGFVTGRSSALIAMSRALKEFVENTLKIDNVLFVPNGVDTDSYRPLNREAQRAKLGLFENAKIVISIGNFVALKGFDQLVQALPAVVAVHPSAVLVLIGDGSERAQLQKTAETLGLAHRVRFTGYVSPSRIPEWLNAADLFVLPSLSEGQSCATLEAMACSLPVVATRVGGIPESIEDGKNGFLVEPRRPDQLAERINLLLGDPLLSRRFGVAGRESVVQKKLTWEQHVDRLLTIYNNVLQKSSKAATAPDF